MATTLLQLRQYTLLLINEAYNTTAGELPTGTGGVPVLTTDDALDYFINNALQQLVRCSTPINGVGSLWTQVDQPNYGVRDFTVIGGELWAVRSVDWGGLPLQYIDRSTLEGYYPDWSTSTSGTPTLWSGGDDTNIQIFRAPMGTQLLRAGGFIQPNNLVNPSDPVLYLSDALLTLIPKYAAVQFCIKNMDDTELYPRVGDYAAEWNAETQRLWALLPKNIRDAHYRTPPEILSTNRKA